MRRTARSSFNGTGTACSVNCMGPQSKSRIARDFMEVPGWLNGGPEPVNRKRDNLSCRSAQDHADAPVCRVQGRQRPADEKRRAGFSIQQEFDHTVFFGENVDIHHIFPQDWCKARGIKPAAYNSIINKTPLSYRTNKIIGGVAPSEYLGKLEKGNSSTPPITPQKLDSYLVDHLMDPSLLRSDCFAEFMEDRQRRLLVLIEQAMGKAAYAGSIPGGGEDDEAPEDSREAALVLTSDR